MLPKTLPTLFAASLLLAACAQTAPQGSSTSSTPAAAAVKVDRSRSEMNRDDGIARIVLRNLAEADKAAFRAVSAEVFNGRALLMGAVVKPEQRRRAEQVAAKVEGISEVINELVLAEEAAFPAFTSQMAQESTLRGRILSEDGIRGFYSVRVVNNVAYVMGVSPGPEESERVKAMVLDSPGVKWAVLHVRNAK